MRWQTAVRISEAPSPTAKSTIWLFVAPGTGHDSTSRTVVYSRGRRPSRSRALTSACGPDKSRCVHAGPRDRLQHCHPAPDEIAQIPPGRDDDVDHHADSSFASAIFRGEVRGVSRTRALSEYRRFGR